MTDFELFIQKNNLLKRDVATYMDVSNAFVTQLCSGVRALPQQKLALIKANDKGWDTSMLERQGGNISSSIIINGNKNSTINNDNRQYFSDSPDVLRAQIDMLDERIKEKDAQIKEKDAQIKEKDAQIKEKDAQIKEKDAQIRQLLDIIQGRRAEN